MAPCRRQDGWIDCKASAAEFLEVVFSQFQEQLKDHGRQVGEQLTWSAGESEALAHDQHLFPRRMENCRGEPVFDISSAKLLLRADVDIGKHNRMMPSQLRQTREEYTPFDARKSKHRIYQEVCRKKFLHFLEQKRAMALN
jgi:hypothetical protein